MANYILVCNDILREDGPPVKAVDIITRLTQHGAWFCTATAPKRARLQEGDRLLYYVCGKGYRCFVGQGVVAAAAIGVTDEDQVVMEELGVGFMSWRIPVRDITTFDKPVDMRALVPTLDFIKDKQNWGLHLRMPIVTVGDVDFQRIVERVPAKLGFEAQWNG